MGAWGTDSFENDTACDWAFGVVKSKDLTLIEKAIDSIGKNKGFINDDDVHIAIAAADVIARLRRKCGQQDPYTEDIDKWVATLDIMPGKELIMKALQAITIIQNDPKSSNSWFNPDERRRSIALLKKRLEDCLG